MKKNLLFIIAIFFSLGLRAQYWSQQNTNMTGTSTYVDQISIVDSSIVWVNGANGSGSGSKIKAFSRTQDGGATWQAGTYNGFGATVFPYVLTAASYTKAFCIAMDTVSDVASFWQTTDGGATWTTVTGVLNNGSTTFADGVEFWGNGKGFCYGDPVSSVFNIYTTTDNGTTWTAVPSANISAPLSGEYGYNGHDCASVVAGGIGFFVTNKNRVYKTTDYGANWAVTASLPFVSTTNVSAKICASSANYVIVANLPTSTSTNYDWRYSPDGGTTWDTLVAASGTLYEYDMCNVPDTINKFIATSPYTTAPGIAYSNDGGINWTDFQDATYLQPTGSNVQCLGVGFYNNSIGWVGNYDLAQTINSILKYHPTAIGTDAGVLSILQPSGVTSVGSTVQVKVQVKNFGSTNITSLSLNYQLGPATPVTTTWTGTLKPDSTLDYTFTTTFVAPDSLNYNLCASAVATGDIYPSNNEICETLHGNVGINENYLNGLSLNQNYPNPSNGNTTIGFTVPNNGEVVFSLMNSVGKIVSRESKNVSAGSNQIKLNTSNFAAGIYFYEFEFNGIKLYRKMIIN
jgi:hypothetical protein